MRLLLSSNATHDPPQGGSTRSNLAWLRALAHRGHECRVVCPTPAHEPDRVTEPGGIRIQAISGLSMHPARLSEEIHAFQPDWVLISSEDVTHVLLREAGEVAPGRLIYLAHTPQFFPFGPESWNADAASTRVVQQARMVVAIGRHMQGYIWTHAGVAAEVIHPPMYGAAPWKRFGRFGEGPVLMINPCIVKGIEIFLGLADLFPRIEFAGLVGWGTTSQDRSAMALRPNIRVLETVPDIEDALRMARLLLMPSVWYEGFGLIAMEAMLRGLPVIASNSGGLKEAKEGTGYVVPVQPVSRYLSEFDETGMPRAVVEKQDLAPWAAALDRLLTDEAEYWGEAEASRQAAERFVKRLDIDDFARSVEALPIPDAPIPAPSRQKPLDDARRLLLLERLRRKSQA